MSVYFLVVWGCRVMGSVAVWEGWVGGEGGGRVGGGRPWCYCGRVGVVFGVRLSGAKGFW